MPAREMRWAGRRVSSFPSKTTRPCIAGSSPAIARKSVVLPAPFEPTIATASPERTSTSIPSITRSPRYPAARPATSSNARPPEIRVDDPRVAHHDLGRALYQELAEVENDDSLGELGDGAHHVLDPEDRQSELVQDVADDLDRRGELRIVEPCHHLVEQQHLGLPCKRLRQLEEPQLVEVQARDRLLGPAPQVDEPERPRCAQPRFPLADDAVTGAEHCAEEDVLEHGQGPEGERLLHGHGNPALPDLMGRETVDPRAVQPDAPVGRPLQADDQLQERALPGAVRTDDGDDVAVVDPERDAVDGRETAEVLCDPVDLEEQASPPANSDGTASAAVSGRSPSARRGSEPCSTPSPAVRSWSGSRTAVALRSSRPTPSTSAARRTRGC